MQPYQACLARQSTGDLAPQLKTEGKLRGNRVCHQPDGLRGLETAMPHMHQATCTAPCRLQASGQPACAQGLAHTGTLAVTSTRATGAREGGTAKARSTAPRWRPSTLATGVQSPAQSFATLSKEQQVASDGQLTSLEAQGCAGTCLEVGRYLDGIGEEVRCRQA